MLGKMGILIYNVYNKYFKSRLDKNSHRQQVKATVVFKSKQAVGKFTLLKNKQAKHAKQVKYHATHGAKDVPVKKCHKKVNRKIER